MYIHVTENGLKQNKTNSKCMDARTPLLLLLLLLFVLQQQRQGYRSMKKVLRAQVPYTAVFTWLSVLSVVIRAVYTKT